MSSDQLVYHGRISPYRGSRVLYPHVQIGFDPILKKPIKAVYAYENERDVLLRLFMDLCKVRLGAAKVTYWIDQYDKIHFTLVYDQYRKPISRKQMERVIVHLYSSKLDNDRCSGWVKVHLENGYISTHPQPYVERRIINLNEFLQGGTIDFIFPDADPVHRIVF